jgi:tRNA threonylcarbamoyladenosine biosynthesis protein TsaE
MHTEAFAQRLASLVTTVLQQGQRVHIELRGDLGAGKTTFTRHLLRHMGVAGRIKSPSYGVVHPYEVNGLSIWHFDFYRFEDPREWEDAGFRDIFDAPGLTVVEWPDKVGGLLPPADVCLQLSTAVDESRHAQLQGHTALWQAWQTSLALNLRT